VSPSPSTSSRAACTAAASVPLAPKRTVDQATVVASKVAVVRIATSIVTLLLGLMLFGKLPGLMSIPTAIGPAAEARSRTQVGTEPSAKLDTAFVTRATDLLSTTRLLIDSPAAGNPDLRSLMSDLELVLAQIVQLRQQPYRGEIDLIADALQERELLPRIHTAVTMAANN